MMHEGDEQRGSAQWLAAAGCLLLLTCLLAWLAQRHPVYVGFEPRPTAATAPPDMRLDLNAASVAELQALPRIGPALAARIAEDRDANGPFASLQDLDRVNGIGERTIALIAPHVVVLSPEADER